MIYINMSIIDMWGKHTNDIEIPNQGSYIIP
jgi:hypothetical protein